jgi:hypothetical protein
VLDIDFVNRGVAAGGVLAPPRRGVGGTTTRYEAPDGDTLLRVIQAWTILAGTTVV